MAFGLVFILVLVLIAVAGGMLAVFLLNREKDR